MKISQFVKDKKLFALTSGAIFIFLGIVLILYLFFFSASTNKYWQISVEGNKVLSKKDVQEVVSYLMQTEIEGISAEQIEKALLLNPRIKMAYVYVRPNKRIKIVIKEKQTAYIEEMKGRFLEVAQDNSILEEDIQRLNNSMSPSLPIIVVPVGRSKYVDGFKNKNKKSIVDLYNQTQRNYSFIWERISEIIIYKYNVVIYPTHIKTKIIISNQFDKQILKRLWALFYYLDKISTTKKFKTIELNKDNAVLKNV